MAQQEWKIYVVNAVKMP